jgi:hypothetical protein
MKMRKLDGNYKDPKERVVLTEAEIKEKKLTLRKLYGEVELLKEGVEPLRWELYELNAKRDSDCWHLIGSDRIGEALRDIIDKEFDIRALQVQITGLKWDITAGSPKEAPVAACSTT